jgi:hypothetical protein
MASTACDKALGKHDYHHFINGKTGLRSFPQVIMLISSTCEIQTQRSIILKVPRLSDIK